MNLLVLAGGFGTRLKPVLEDVPKALAPINGVPFLYLQIENWISQGLREFTFLLHYQAEYIINFLQSHKTGLFNKCQFNWVIESAPLGTGGAIAHAVKSFGMKNDFLVANADTWVGDGVSRLIQSTIPSMAVINLPDVSRYGQVNFDLSNRVTSFVEKNGEYIGGWINAGLYHLSVNHFVNWDGRPFSLERELFSALVQDRRLNVVPLKTDFIDIGVPADYYRFCRWVATGRQEPLCN